MNPLKVIFTSLCCSCLSLTFSLQANTLPSQIQKALDKYRLPNQSISIYIEEVGNTTPLLDWRSNQLITPASTMKLITTYAGMDLLGPDFTWDTRFYIDAPVIKGVVDGHLYIKGSGDPLLINETLEAAIIAIKKQGITTIKKGLIIDNSYFEMPKNQPNSLDGYWQESYNALPDAANINFGTAALHINTARYSSRPTVTLDPPLANYKVFSRMRMRGGKCSSQYLEPKIELVPYSSQTTISISGQYAKRCGNRTLYRVLTKPDRLLYSVVRNYWRHNGGKFTGGYKYGEIPQQAKLIYTHKSAPLIEQIALMNKKSNNVMTRQLFLTLSAEKMGAPGNLKNSRQLVFNWLKQKGINPKDSYIDNGSGLSRKSVLSTQLIAALLNDAAQHHYAEQFRNSLSLAGVDGTMRNRFSNHQAKAKLHMKTGTLNGVRAIAGYVMSQSGKIYSIASIQKHPNLSGEGGRRIQDTILKWAYHQ